MLTNLIVVIVSQYICVLNLHIVCLLKLHRFCVSKLSIKLGENRVVREGPLRSGYLSKDLMEVRE